MEQFIASKIRILFLPVVILLFGSCEKPCLEDEFFNTSVHLMAESLAKNPYQDGTRAIFINEAGQEITYLVEGFYGDKFPNYIATSVGKLCSRRKTSSSLFVDAQRMQGTLRLEKRPNEQALLFYFQLNIRNKESSNPYDTLLADVLRIVSQPDIAQPSPAAVRPPSEMNIITSKRGKDISFDELVDHVYLENISFLGKEFEQVYVNNNGLLEIYYNFLHGVVAFDDLNKMVWRFDRIE